MQTSRQAKKLKKFNENYERKLTKRRREERSEGIEAAASINKLLTLIIA